MEGDGIHRAAGIKDGDGELWNRPEDGLDDARIGVDDGQTPTKNAVGRLDRSGQAANLLFT